MSPMNLVKGYARAIGARSSFDISGMAVRRDSLFPAPRWRTLDAEATVAYDLARVMVRFGLSAKCGADALAAGQEIAALPAGCTNGAVPRRLPLRHVTATHAAVRR